MKNAVWICVAVLLGLLAGTPAKACGLYPSAIVAPVIVSPVVQTVAVAPVVTAVVTPAVVTPTVGSVALISPVVVPVATPVFAFNTFHGYGHVQNVVVQREVIVRDSGVNQKGLVNANVGRGGGVNQRGLVNLNLGGRRR